MSFMQRLYYKKKKDKQKSLKKLAANERAHTRNFIFFEIVFIIIAIPLLIVGLASIPISMYFAIVKDFRLWPIVIIGVVVSLSQILATQFFVRKYFLNPFNLTLGEYLRMRYDIRIEKKEQGNENSLKTWYDNLDEFIIRIKTEQREQTNRMYLDHIKQADINQNS
ncbi:MAG: hypothetical protein JXA54_02910 [Candidatus Heimdallarchaeota archaeon]|nr:hypothetical protein [Candidatus Heimdallarchaeota archaeon]